ncbi:MAG: kinase-regulated stress-responsive transcription factor skn7 [Pycnora praestabilis]|nr:MAG: kinase-regulated stress-responsive transcription factor skn7 [Pycnora praestabilis]
MDGQGGGGSAANNSSDFVRKLYKMLEDPTYDSVVRWGDGGKSFVVLENEKFTKNILPKHFKHSNFASFVRQLNKYDFHKVRHNNEDSGQSPYGLGAWEFHHPEFLQNNKDSLDNIRRKAPAPRKATQASEEAVPTQQMDLVNTQLIATQQQLQQLQERYNELSLHHSMMLQELIGVQKTVVNHEHVMQNVMSFLHSVDARQRRDSRAHGNPFQQPSESGPNTANVNTSAQQITPLDDEPASPLQNASKLLNDSSADALLNHKHLEQMNEMHSRVNGLMSTPPPDSTARNVPGMSRGGHPQSASSSTSVGHARINGDLPENIVYPVGQSNGIDPMYSEHIHNIPYPMPSKEPDPTDPRTLYADGRKKSTQVDPGWSRAPQILLVEDDQTCRRIGSKFLYSFHCAIDSALDGLEAVNKMNAGSKYDLVLMDIIMPNLDGVSATHLIRQFDSTPIIAMTSNIRSDDISMYFAHGMNDVLPKPFTKEGLLNMLEKHLGHLKKSTHGIEPLGPPGAQAMAHGSTRQSLKDENSPGKSPSTITNWQSPTQVPGVSPTTNSVTDEYMQAIRGHSGAYGMDPSMQHDGMAYHSPQAPMSAGRQGPHRRQISEISGADDMTNDVKRQRVFAPPPSTAPMHPMQRGRGM